MEAFRSANAWADDHLPAASWRMAEKPDPQKGLLSNMTAALLDRLGPERLNQFLFRITSRRWQLKKSRAQKNVKGIPVDLITGIHVARSNPGNFQEKVLEQYKIKVQEAETAFIRSAEPVRICAAVK